MSWSVGSSLIVEGLRLAGGEPVVHSVETKVTPDEPGLRRLPLEKLQGKRSDSKQTLDVRGTTPTPSTLGKGERQSGVPQESQRCLGSKTSSHDKHPSK